MTIAFIILASTIIYTYVGYPILLATAAWLKNKIKTVEGTTETGVQIEWPEVTFFVPAHNEEDCLQRKLENLLEIDYPASKIKFVLATEGSTDNTPIIVDEFMKSSSLDIQHIRGNKRRGKVGALNMAINSADTPILIISDANNLTNAECVKKMVVHFTDPRVGAVSGEKRLFPHSRESIHQAGEGVYWKYESMLKKWDSELNTLIGAAGELVAFRVKFIEGVPEDMILEDFFLSMKLVAEGFRVVYEPAAFGYENSALEYSGELERKIRISAGAFQVLGHLPFFRWPGNPLTFIQYFSHRVLRWTVTPLALPLIFLVNIPLAFQGSRWFGLFLILQVTFLLCAAAGFLLRKRPKVSRIFTVPFYFILANFAVFAGIARWIRGKQSAKWQRVERSNYPEEKSPYL